MAKRPGRQGRDGGTDGSHPDRDPPLRGRAAIEEIDARLGGLLGPLGEALGKIVDAAEQASREADRQAPGGGGQAGAEDATAGPLRATAGFRMRVGGQAFGASDLDPGRGRRAGPAPRGPAPAAPRTPEFESWTRDGLWTLTAEVPGARPEDLSLRIEDGRLIAEIAGARPWRIETEAPTSAPEAISAHLLNGILELTAQATT